MNKILQKAYFKLTRTSLIGWILAAILLILVVYYTIPLIFSDLRDSDQLVIYAFSTQEEVFTQGIFPAFENAWREKTGQELTIHAVFGPSGTLAGQVNLGAPADVVIFSNQRHINWLKLGKLIKKDTEPVLIASTPLVIVTRPDNPMQISDFQDLTKPGLRLLHADPNSSGLGEWTILAEYGSVYLENKDKMIAKEQLRMIWENVRILGSSARATMTIFELGAGDALVTYEHDAFLAQERGIPLNFFIPQRTILARHFAAIVDHNVAKSERQIAEAFMDYLLSPVGQQIMMQYYLRPVKLENDLLPKMHQVFTEDELGGWAEAYDTLIENVWKREIMPYLVLEPASTFLEREE